MSGPKNSGAVVECYNNNRTIAKAITIGQSSRRGSRSSLCFPHDQSTARLRMQQVGKGVRTSRLLVASCRFSTLRDLTQTFFLWILRGLLCLCAARGAREGQGPGPPAPGGSNGGRLGAGTAVFAPPSASVRRQSHPKVVFKLQLQECPCNRSQSAP